MLKRTQKTSALSLVEPGVAPLALNQLFLASASARDYVVSYQHRMLRMLEGLDERPIAELIQLLEQACKDNRQIFLMGNGGSSAVASHMVVDLAANSLQEGLPGFRVFSLSDNTESITAIANDWGYENIFSHQLTCHLQAGDLVIAFSVSGNSPNVIRGVEVTKEKGGTTVGLTGFDGGRLRELCDLSIHIPATRDEYGPVEDLFACIGHMVTTYLTLKRGRNLNH